jgi:hypothetical protein
MRAMITKPGVAAWFNRGHPAALFQLTEEAYS